MIVADLSATASPFVRPLGGPAMIPYRALSVFAASLVVVACSGTDATISTPDSGASDSGGNDSGGNDDSSLGTDSGLGNDSGPGDPATIDLTFATKCALFTPCGGNVVGAWDYVAGCTGDPWAAARQNCQALGVKNQKGTVKGRITFTSTTVTRDATVAYSATLTVPASCLQGVLTCPQIEAGLKKVVNSATCVPASGGCDCDVASTQSVNSSGTSYTAQGNQIVLSDGNKYDYCATGGVMQSTHVAGNTAESGVFELTKR
ncbi:MAG TPA: hypothetical protein VF316_07195 [Polyangiaceae bacterium]